MTQQQKERSHPEPNWNNVIIHNLWLIRHDPWARHAIRNAIKRSRNLIYRSR